MSRKINTCPGGMPVQTGKEPTAKGATFPGSDGTPFGAVREGRAMCVNFTNECALRAVAKDSSKETGTRRFGCYRQDCQDEYTAKNVASEA